MASQKLERNCLRLSYRRYVFLGRYTGTVAVLELISLFFNLFIP